MAWAIVGLAGNGADNNSTTTVTLTVTATAGNHLVLQTRTAAAVTISSISDGVNTWQFDRNTSGNCQMASCKVASNMSAVTVTITFSAAVTGKITWAHEFSGLHATTWFDTATSAAVFFNGTSRNFGGSTITPSAIGNLLIASWGDTSAETWITAGAGYTNLPGVTGSGYYNSNAFIEGVYGLAASTSAQSASATGGASPTGYSCVMGSYIAAAATALPPLPVVVDTAVSRASNY